MFNNLEAFQAFGKEHLEATAASASNVTKSLQAIAAEAGDYSKKSLEQNTAFVEKLLGVRKLDEAVALQQDFAKSAYEGFVSQMTKMGELYTGLAKEAFRPVENAVAKVRPSA
jgi:phasin family protein